MERGDGEMGNCSRAGKMLKVGGADWQQPKHPGWPQQGGILWGEATGWAAWSDRDVLPSSSSCRVAQMHVLQS